ncbi:biotin-dependent carboxyltransferase family protein [Xenophilus arseniciresistens]|uniref:Biotin-dependent carboxyltransferase family protein n=1 Tax=Xenophilus arseniciresistens TaxID=1283306 RepID=A0AAE3N5E7_9BURK|nr:biotin-dependent carboxyltransferase family protein [Xenophilus arseniciresistens]MDA7415561.1 biotin-dependent carboxyltransferase family protein [Xenophilus arseniciresistens]
MSSASSSSAAALTVLRPGLLASVQDLGRQGHRQLGVCPGGALDGLALTLANRLVGNAAGAAGLELTLGACALRFEQDTRMALAGDDFDAQLDGLPVRPLWSLPVRAGQTLVLGGANRARAKPGVRSWLAVAGGIDVPLLLGSRSTDLKAGFGGLQGRALRKGDRLGLGPSALSAAQRAQAAFGLREPQGWDGGAKVPQQAAVDAPTVLRVLPGPEAHQFDAAAKAQFHAAHWRITPQSNRMGSRLEGPALRRVEEADMLSSAVIPGTVQVPPSGQPIILMGDAQTTGGYPRIAVVIRADLWKLAQAPLGGRLQMQAVDAAQALTAWQAQQRHLAQIEAALAMRGWPVPSQHAA